MMTMLNLMTSGFSTAFLLSDTAYYILCAILTMGVLSGIHLMSRVETAAAGNRISALAIALGIVLTLIKKDIMPVWMIYPGMAAGAFIGYLLAQRVTMIQMPQLVALLNGIGGAASAIVASFALASLYDSSELFEKATASLAVGIGTITLSGSLIAAGKLHKILPQKPVLLPLHALITTALAILTLLLIVSGSFFHLLPPSVLLPFLILISGTFGVVFAIRVGGADMPITISLLNSLSGVAAAIAGFAVTDLLLVSVGGIVGASGLFLTQIMCRAMNRNLTDILLGKTSVNAGKKQVSPAGQEIERDEPEPEIPEPADPIEMIKNAHRIIMVPGYGMALAHAQHIVKSLAQKLATRGATVKYAIHPVAGRMPGHMDVLLIEAGIPFEDVYEMDEINGEFKDADVTIVIGANDVLNPAARDAKGTPIYGMPILNVDQCRNIIIFNYDLQPGYAGVDNPIYKRNAGVWVIQGNAADTIPEFLSKL